MSFLHVSPGCRFEFTEHDLNEDPTIMGEASTSLETECQNRGSILVITSMAITADYGTQIRSLHLDFTYVQCHLHRHYAHLPILNFSVNNNFRVLFPLNCNWKVWSGIHCCVCGYLYCSILRRGTRKNCFTLSSRSRTVSLPNLKEAVLVVEFCDVRNFLSCYIDQWKVSTLIITLSLLFTWLNSSLAQ